MASSATAIPARRAHVRRLAGAALFTAALAATPFAHPAIALAGVDGDFYNFCVKQTDQGQAYCCQKAGGVLNGDSCVDPATLGGQSPPPVITQTQAPAPVIIVPPPR